MRHVPFFRWVLTLGFVLLACAVGLHAAGSGLPGARQIDLTVLKEGPDGSCTVRWVDPYQKRLREAPYQCDPGRGDLLKAPRYAGSHEYGWETAYMLTEGPDRGNLEKLADDEGRGAADVLLMTGIPLVALGLVGGNLRDLPRVLGVRRQLIRRAADLHRAAAGVSEEHGRALAAVGETAHPGVLAQGAETAAASRHLTALWVLREAGPEANTTAVLGRKLARRLQRLLEDAAPAAGLRSMLRAGPAARSDAARAVAELHGLLADAERDGVRERFTETSVDLLRGQDTEWAALAAATDFARDPAAYTRLSVRLTQPAGVSRQPASRQGPPRRRRK